jgi:predicted phosphodiesterase
MSALLFLLLLAPQASENQWRAARVPQPEILSFDASLLPDSDTAFAIVSDTHVEPEGPPFSQEGMDDPDLKFRKHSPALTNNARFIRAVEQINELDLDFAVHLGDIVRSMPFAPTFDQESKLSLRILERFNVPYYLAPGNHDIGNKPSMGFPGSDRRSALKKAGHMVKPGEPALKLTVCEENTELYRGIFGDPFFSWDHEGNHFIVLNTMAFNSGIPGDAEQWEWLRTDLEANKDARNIIMFGHVGLYWATPADIGFRNYEVIDEPARSTLLDLINRYDIDNVFTGHTHHMFRNRYGDSQLITAPSTAFTRDTWHLYPHMPGRTMDAAKLAYLLVRLKDDRVVTNLIRVVDEGLPDARTAQAGILPSPSRVVTLQSVESHGARLLIEAPAPLRVEPGWQAHDLLDGFIDQQPGMYEGRHAWRSFAGVGAFDLPIELRVELAQDHEITEVNLRGLWIQADWVLESSRDGEAWELVGSGTADHDPAVKRRALVDVVTVLESSREGEGWESVGPGEAALESGLLRDVTMSFPARPMRFLRLTIDGELPPAGSFVEMTLAEIEALDSAGVNRASEKEGARAWSNGFGSSPREAIRDQGWLAAYDLATRQVRVATHGASSWQTVEHRPGALRVPPDLIRALAAGKQEGLQLSLPLTPRHSDYVTGTEADREAFTAYCRYVAEQVGEDVATWELSFTQKNALGAPSGTSIEFQQFVDKFFLMREAVLAVNPHALFALSGVPLDNPLVARRLLKTLGDHVDRVSVDPRGSQLSVSDESILELMSMVQMYRELASDAEWTVDLRPLEVSNRPRLGALRIARAFIRLQSKNILLGLRLDGSTGLLDAVDDPYNAFYSMRLLATLFDGGLDPVEDPEVFLEANDVEQMSFQRADGTWLVAAWANYRTDELRGKLMLPPGRSAVAYDTMTCTSQELRITQDGERSVAPGVLLRSYPMVFVVR